MYVTAPKQYPQTTCGVDGCNEILDEPNHDVGTSKLCKKCWKKLGF